jgi:hypothetical protein
MKMEKGLLLSLLRKAENVPELSPRRTTAQHFISDEGDARLHIFD